jgi:hypothetical protein
MHHDAAQVPNALRGFGQKSLGAKESLCFRLFPNAMISQQVSSETAVLADTSI